MLSSTNVGLAPSIPLARGRGGNGGTIKKYLTFFSYMNEKQDIQIELNEVVVPKNKQGVLRLSSQISFYQ